jgi:small-conductance mechanosensitive channel
MPQSINKYRKFYIFGLIIIVIGVLGLSACRPEPTPGPYEPPTLTPTATKTETPSPTPLPTDTPAPTAEGDSEPIVTTPTLAPTATPGALANFVEKLVADTGVEELEMLGLTGEDWINLLISALMVALSVFILARITYYFLKVFVRRTSYKYDDILLEKVRSQIYWFFGILALRFGTTRLAFLPPPTKQWLQQIYNSLMVVLIAVVVWQLLDIAIQYYADEVETQHEEHKVDTILQLLHRLGRSFIAIVTAIMILSINNINVNVLIAALGIGGLAFSLAAQDTLANLISGVLISLDQPFRVGDRIEIPNLDTWGDVVDIGLRTTRIRTRDNRMVIIPNSKIGSDQVINYTFPDTQYRIQMEISIPYGKNIEQVRQIIVSTVKKVDGVLQDKPVEALYVEMTGLGMVFRIRWWIESYVDTRQMYDKVNTTLQKEFDEIGITLPNPGYDIYLKETPGEHSPPKQTPDENKM